MSIIDQYKQSKLGVVANYGEPATNTPNWGFYSPGNLQSPETLTNNPEFSLLHNEYSLNDNPKDLRIVANNPEAWYGYPYESTLDPLDIYAPKLQIGGVVSQAYNSSIGEKYTDKGPAEGRY